jgi:hypothetical protein
MMRRLLPLFVVALAGGCTDRGPRCGSGPARMELRDGAGTLQLRITESAKHGELDLCDPSNHRIGLLVASGETLTLYDRHNAERLVVTGDAESIKGPSGAEVIRVHRDGTMIRILSGDGVPFGTVNDRDGGAFVSDPASTPLARVASRDADLVLSGPDGTVKRYLVPGTTQAAAGILALEALPLEDRVFLAAHLGHGRLQP